MSAVSVSESASLRDRLLSKAGELEGLVQPPASSDEHPERELEERKARRWGWYRTLEDGVLDLANLLPAGTEDYEARKLFEFLTELRRAMEEDLEVTDRSGHVALACAKMDDVLARMARRLEHTALEDPQRAAEYLFESLAPLSTSDIADLLGVSTKTIGAWKRGGPIRTHSGRVRLVAKLCCYLLPATTPLGFLMWFRASADLLAGKSPLELLGGGEPTPEAWNELVDFARGARGQLAG